MSSHSAQIERILGPRSPHFPAMTGFQPARLRKYFFKKFKHEKVFSDVEDESLTLNQIERTIQ